MNFKIKINNIGKLQDTDISLKPFTVLAGPNNTGKSFVSKILYSVLSYPQNPLWVYMQGTMKPLRRILVGIQRDILDQGHYDHLIVFEKNKDLEKDTTANDDEGLEKNQDTRFNDNSPPSIKETDQSDLSVPVQRHSSLRGNPDKYLDLSKKTSILTDKIKESILHIHKLQNILIQPKPQEITDDFDKKIKEYLKTIIKLSSEILSFLSKNDKAIKDTEAQNTEQAEVIIDLETIQKKDLTRYVDRLKEIEKEPLEQMITKGVIQILKSNLKGNFQVPVLSDLLAHLNKPAEIRLQNYQAELATDITIKLIEKQIQNNPSILKLAYLQKPFRTIYLESPFYWKLRKALLRAGRSYFPTERRSLLVPKYFKDLNIMLTEELAGEPAFPDILKKMQTDIIKGKIVEDESGTLKFKENKGGAYPLPSTATGVVQLGVLALLIEKKALDKGTILFIDEPEVNLHPAWQSKMMELLFDLVQGGAFVVMATHSVDMLKWLEVYLKENPENEKLVALNQMILKEEGSATNKEPEKDIQAQIQSIKKDLTRSYLKMYLEGTKQKAQIKAVSIEQDKNE